MFVAPLSDEPGVIDEFTKLIFESSTQEVFSDAVGSVSFCSDRIPLGGSKYVRWYCSSLLVLGGRYTHSSVAGTFSWRDVLSHMRVLRVLPGVSEVMQRRSDKHLACVDGGSRNWGVRLGTLQGTGFL